MEKAACGYLEGNCKNWHKYDEHMIWKHHLQGSLSRVMFLSQGSSGKKDEI